MNLLKKYLIQNQKTHIWPGIKYGFMLFTPESSPCSCEKYLYFSQEGNQKRKLSRREMKVWFKWTVLHSHQGLSKGLPARILEQDMLAGLMAWFRDHYSIITKTTDGICKSTRNKQYWQVTCGICLEDSRVRGTASAKVMSQAQQWPNGVTVNERAFSACFSFQVCTTLPLNMVMTRDTRKGAKWPANLGSMFVTSVQPSKSWWCYSACLQSCCFLAYARCVHSETSSFPSTHGL